MSVRYDSILARALAGEILRRWEGARIAGLRMSPGRRGVELAFEDGSRLSALLHPLHGYVFALGGDAPDLGVGGRKLRVGRLSLIAARAPADERALLLVFGDRGRRPWELLAIELRTRHGNALHCRRIDEHAAGSDGSAEPGGGGEPEGGAEPGSGAAWRIETALRPRGGGGRLLRRGERYVPPTSARRGVGGPPSEAEWAAALADAGRDGDDAAAGGAGRGRDDARRRTVVRRWAWTSALNVDWILEAGGTPETYARYRALHALATAAAPAGPAFLLDRPWGAQPYPHALGTGRPADTELLATSARLVARAGGAAALLSALPRRDADDGSDDDAGLLRKRLGSRHKRARRRVAALERQLEAAGPPDEPRLLGQILLARKDEIARGAATAALEGFDGAVREIALDPARDAVANAEAYFEEARRRERARERLPAEIAAARARASEFEAHLERLAASGPSDALWAAAGGRPPRPGTGRSRHRDRRAATRLPYVRLTTTGGLELRVGRGPHDNDELTFRHSAPEDIWLHASQASGAHVILRWGRRDANPSRRDLIEAATAAAVHSTARHSGTAPVAWTRRKYVRKPRKSPPGTVAPSRVQTIFVKPDAELVRRLRDPDAP